MESALSAGVFELVAVVDAEGNAAVGGNDEGEDEAGEPLGGSVLLGNVGNGDLVALGAVA